MAKRIESRPTAGLSYNSTEARYWDRAGLDKEVERVFDICHGCRLCFNLCPSFPALFDAVDRNDGDVRAMTPAEKERVVDLCYGCKLCEIKCPYTPHDGHEFHLDFPRLIMRAKSVNAREDGVKLRERILAHPPLAADSIRRHEGSIEITTRPDPAPARPTASSILWTGSTPSRPTFRIAAAIACATMGRLPIAHNRRKPSANSKPRRHRTLPHRAKRPQFVQRRRASWARLIRRIFEVDPLLCRCGAEMKIISIITDPRVVDRILRHRESQECRALDPFEPRAPPQPGGISLQ